MWILILWLSWSQTVSVTSAEFTNFENCEAAAKAVEIKFYTIYKDRHNYICVKK